LIGTPPEYCVADAAFATPIPDQVESHIAAPVLCGGIAVYSALRKANLRTGDYIVLPGAGGGLGHLGVQIASSLGYRVIAIDAADKEAVCNQSGAAHFLDFRKSLDLIADVRALTDGYGAHAVLCIAGAPSAYDSAIPMLRNCGRLLCVGIPPPDYLLKVSPFEMLVKGLQVIGATVGNRDQMAELMDLVVQGKLKPIVQMYPFEELETVMKKLERAEISGRAVLRIA
jgi:propanol-preferring alcohol dehydrogenase